MVYFLTPIMENHYRVFSEIVTKIGKDQIEIYPRKGPVDLLKYSFYGKDIQSIVKAAIEAIRQENKYFNSVDYRKTLKKQETDYG